MVSGGALRPPVDDAARHEASLRLRTVRGHVESVARMIEEGRRCPEVVHQLSAIQGSIAGIQKALLLGHLRDCVPGDLRTRSIDEVAAEVVGLAFGGRPEARAVGTVESERRTPAGGGA